MRISSAAIGISHWNMKWPNMRKVTDNTKSSIQTVTSWVNRMESTRCSCGNATFLIRLAPPCTEPMLAVTEIAKNWNGSNPDRKYSGKFSRPLALPRGGTPPKTLRKMMLKMIIWLIGFSRLHAHPRTDPRYRVRSSFRVKR